MGMGWDPSTVGLGADSGGSHCVVAQAVRLIEGVCGLF